MDAQQQRQRLHARNRKRQLSALRPSRPHQASGSWSGRSQHDPRLRHRVPWGGLPLEPHLPEACVLEAWSTCAKRALPQQPQGLGSGNSRLSQAANGNTPHAEAAPKHVRPLPGARAEKLESRPSRAPPSRPGLVSRPSSAPESCPPGHADPGGVEVHSSMLRALRGARAGVQTASRQRALKRHLAHPRRAGACALDAPCR